MEKTLLSILEHGLTWPLALSLLQMLIVLFLVMSIRTWLGNLIARRLAFRRLKTNRYLKAGAWVDWPTTTGSVQAQVDRITPDKVVLRARESGLWIHVPILQFAGAPLALIDIRPVSGGALNSGTP